jgi:hypothetical protein
MVDLLLALVSRLIALAKRREEVNRATFVDFVQPAFQTFETVHTDYIDSLTRYSIRLADTRLVMDLNHPVFRDIELDALKSEHLHTRLKDFRAEQSPPKLKPFLSAIDFYLRGVSASGQRAELIDKLALNRLEAFGPEALRVLATDGDPSDRATVFAPSGSRAPILIYADPLREALRVALVGFDAPRDFNEEDARNMILDESARWLDTDESRRRLCSEAVRAAILYFQNSYASVSSAHAALRAELLSPI